MPMTDDALLVRWICCGTPLLELAKYVLYILSPDGHIKLTVNIGKTTTRKGVIRLLVF
jgi:hypothetical protein